MSYEYEPRDYGRRYVHEHSRPGRDAPYADDSYLKPYSTRDLVPRRREDSDLSVEEVRRDFPPPGYRDARRSRSAEPGYYQDYRYDDRYRDYDRYDRDYHRDYDGRSKKSSSSHHGDEDKKSRKRVLNRQEKIIAAVAGAALAFGGKELYDRYDAKEHGTPVERNYLASAALGAAGALAGYQGAEFYNKASKHDKKSQLIAHRGHDDDDDDDDEKKGTKSFLKNALAASGLGAAVKAVTGGSSDGKDDKDDKDDTRSRHGSEDGQSLSRSKPRDDGNDKFAKAQKAAMASLIAGATEAFRVAKEPGSWRGEKAKRIVTAAAGAAAVDSARGSDKDSKLNLAESVIAGLLGNRVIHGSKQNIEEDEKTGRSRSRPRARSRSRSRSRPGTDGGSGGISGLAALATAGLGALGAKKAYDHTRSSSRGRSADSHDSRDDRRNRSRSRSVVDSARRRLAKFGIGSDPDDRDTEGDRGSRRRDDGEYDDARGSRRRRSRRYSSDSYDDDEYDRAPRSSRGARDSYYDYDDDDSYASTRRRRDRSRQRRGGRSDAGSESDLGDSEDDLKTSRRMRGKQVLTTGLAAVATIHAAHGVYQSMEARTARQKAVREGRLSPEEARKLKAKAMLQDAAQVGLAGLSIHSAMTQLESAKKKSDECRDWEQQRAIRRQKRLERQQLRSRDSFRRSETDDRSSSASPSGKRYDYGGRLLRDRPHSVDVWPAARVEYDDRDDRR